MFASKLNALVAAAVVLVAANAAHAHEKAAIVIYNPTENTINYEVRWNSSEWKLFSVPPRQERAHWINLRSGQSVPSAVVRFDYIGGDGAVTYKSYTLDYYIVNDAFRGRTYFFRYDSTGRFLDLLHETGR